MTQDVEKIVERYSKLGKVGTPEILACIPKEERRYKCHTCYSIVDKEPCPECGEKRLEIMCPLDHCHCGHDITTKFAYCPLCGQPMCPECNCHNILQISRVTGYLADVSGYNRGKQQEVKDRRRSNPEEICRMPAQ